MDKPLVARKAPYPVEVENGKQYFWCSCGRSKKQPFCDGSHEGTPFMPQLYTAHETKTVQFCGCKATKKNPLCDGSHSSL